MEYCRICPNWQHNKDLTSLIRYTVLSEADEEVLEDNMDDENISVTSPNNIEFSRDEEDVPLEICITCKEHYPVQLLGAVVISDARTIECYGGNNDGYVGTCRGILIENCDVDNKIFKCMIYFEDSLQDVSLKFLGLGERKSVTVYKLMPVLLQCENGRTMPPGLQKLDLNKVKGYLHDMGDKIPDNAMSLLQSVETFQNTQMGGMQQLQSMFANLTAANSRHTPATSTAADTSGNPISTTQTQCSTDNVQKPSLPDITQNLGPLQAMMESVVARGQGQVKGQDGSDGQGFMYDMLKNICGKVSNLRTTEAEVEEKDAQPNRSVEPNSDVNGENNTMQPVTVSSSLITEDVQSIVKQVVQQTEERLMLHIDTSMAALENRLIQRLDKLLHKVEESLEQKEENT